MTLLFLARGKHLEAMEANGLTVISDDEKFVVDGTFTNSIHKFLDAELIFSSNRQIHSRWRNKSMR